jgi:hypothetical protein
MSQNESAARTRPTRTARLKSRAARPALIALAAAGVIAGSTGMAAAATSASAAPAASAATAGFSHGKPIHLVGHRSSRDVDGKISYTATSTTWSGYAATAGTYTSVSASWTQPAGHCSNGQYAAFWAGLDGYNSSTVEQTGTAIECAGSTPVYSAWYEMYPAPPVNYTNTVRAGDHFNATVTYKGGSTFSLYLADTTQGWSHTTTATVAGAARSSAEVIAEAPSSSSGALPLANFATWNVFGSTANGSPLGNAGGLTSIYMVNNAGQQKDTVSPLSSGENFSATWLRSS